MTMSPLPKATNHKVRIRSVRTGTPNLKSGWDTINTSTTTDSPATPTISSQTTTTATITWTPVSGATAGYQIQYCAHHATTCTTTSGSDYATNSTTTTQTTKNLTSLTSGTTYNIRVRTRRTTSDGPVYSNWATTSFITKPENILQSSLTASPQTTSVALDWDDVTGASAYNIHYCTGTCTTSTPESPTTATNSWRTGATTTTSSKTITGLTTDTAYQFRVQAVKILASPSDTQVSDLSLIHI